MFWHVRCRYLACYDMWGTGISHVFTYEVQVSHMLLYVRCRLQVSLMPWHVRYMYLSCFDMWGAGISHAKTCEVQVSLVLWHVRYRYLSCFDMWGAGVSHDMTCEVLVSVMFWHVRCSYLSCYDMWGAGISLAMPFEVQVSLVPWYVRLTHYPQAKTLATGLCGWVGNYLRKWCCSMNTVYMIFSIIKATTVIAVVCIASVKWYNAISVIDWVTQLLT